MGRPQKSILVLNQGWTWGQRGFIKLKRKKSMEEERDERHSEHRAPLPRAGSRAHLSFHTLRFWTTGCDLGHEHGAQGKDSDEQTWEGQGHALTGPGGLQRPWLWWNCCFGMAKIHKSLSHPPPRLNQKKRRWFHWVSPCHRTICSFDAAGGWFWWMLKDLSQLLDLQFSEGLKFA